MIGKRDLRQELRRRLRSLSPETFRREGLRAADLLRGHPLWQRYSSLLIFLSIDRGEIDAGPLLEAALADGKTVFAPQVRGEELRFWRVCSPAGPWAEGPLGLREPVPSPGGSFGFATGSDDGFAASLAIGPAVDPADLPALVITPGLGFDRRGGRLGRGKGYYDRFFADFPALCALGLCTTAQVVPEVPREPHDRGMDGLCTGEELILFNIENDDCEGSV